jgi:competence protein ComEC
VAPHHGGNNGSSQCFIAAVDPRFVIFSAGHDHQHPTKAAADRYLTHGVSLQNIFRTDRGDDESGLFEWKAGSIAGCVDPRGDDDVEIVIRQNGTVEVAYRQVASGC